MDRCPACRSRMTTEPVCPRCGCDFSLASRAETQAYRLTCRALQAWADGNAVLAVEYINQSLALKRERLAESIAVLLRATSTHPRRHTQPRLSSDPSFEREPI